MLLRRKKQGKMLAECQRNCFRCIPATEGPSIKVQLSGVKVFLIIVLHHSFGVKSFKIGICFFKTSWGRKLANG